VTSTALSLTRIRKRYGAVVALDNVTLKGAMLGAH